MKKIILITLSLVCLCVCVISLNISNTPSKPAYKEVHTSDYTQGQTTYALTEQEEHSAKRVVQNYCNNLIAKQSNIDNILVNYTPKVYSYKLEYECTVVYTNYPSRNGTIKVSRNNGEFSIKGLDLY